MMPDGTVALSRHEDHSPQGFLRDPIQTVRQRAQVGQTLGRGVVATQEADVSQGFSEEFAALEALDRSMQQCRWLLRHGEVTPNT